MKYQTGSILLLTLSLTLWACGQQQERAQPSPPGYDLSVYEKILVGDDLLEISGIAFAPGHWDTLYAHQDEEGALFKVALPSGKYQRIDFAGPGDFEDIAIQSDTVLMLESDGSFYGLLLDNLTGREATPFARWEMRLPKGEYEGLFADALTGCYYALCKSCKGDKKSEVVTVYQLRLDADELIVTGTHRIDMSAVLGATDKKKKTPFRPAALARHPVTRDFYMVSAVNKVLVILNGDWQVTGHYPLKRNDLLQPEGLAFDRAGNMYISSEGDEIQAGRILKFDYTPQK